MAFEPTKSQKDAIDNRSSLLVSAAAGSGKTAVLVERVVQCVMDGTNPTDIDRMLVVTFTNAAAGEMRERIRRRLAEESAKDPDNVRLLKQQMLLQKANICTIDSFCKNLVAEHFAPLGLNPDFQLISANALSVIKTAAMEETLNTFFETKTDSFVMLTQILGADQDVKNLQEAIEKIYSYLRSLAFPRSWSRRVCDEYASFTTVGQSAWGQKLFERAEKKINRTLRSLKDVIACVAGDELIEAKRGELLRNALAQLQEVGNALQRQDWDAVAEAGSRLEPISYKSAALRGNCDGQIKQMTVAAQGLVGSMREWLQKTFFMSADECQAQCRLLSPMVELLMEAVWDYHDRIEAKKREKNLLDFSDLEHFALQLLAEEKDGQVCPTQYGQALCDNYDYVMVDEYQDVNNLQSEIFHAISRQGERLFVVGDVKQSIYRFRKANPNIFLRLFKAYPDYDGTNSPAKVVLDGNFRSRVGICETVNQLFSLIMTEGAGELDYDENHMLNSLGSFPEDDAPAAELTFIDTDDGRSNREVEADYIAARIKEAMETPCVSDGDTLRPARYHDCVILLRSLKDKAEVYVERLRQHGIPAVAEQTVNFFEQPEVLQVLSVLQAVNNPTDDVALLACMLSGVFGFTPDDVAEIRGKNKKIPLYSSAESAAQKGNAKAAYLITTLQNLRLYGATVSAARLLDEIYDRYGYLAAVQVMENGNSRRRNLLALRELAAECEQNGFDRIDGFIRYTEKLKEENADVGKTTVAESEAVRVMSIHHSKGLQFPICFVAGCFGRFNRTDSNAPVLLDEGLGLGLTLTDDVHQMRLPTCMRLAVSAENRRAEQSEELRVLYVATTRAIDRLVITGCLSNPEKNITDHATALAGNVDALGRLDPELVLSASSYQNLLLYFALLHPAGHILRTYANTEFGFLAGSDQNCKIDLVAAHGVPLPGEVIKEELWGKTDETLVQAIGERLGYQDPNAPLRNVFAKRSVSQLSHTYSDQNQYQMPRPSFMQQDGLSAAKRGTALHGFMQYADWKNAAEHLEGEILRLEQEGFLTPEQTRVLPLQSLQVFFASDLFGRMTNSRRLMREYQVMSALPATLIDDTLPSQFAQERVVVQGVTDCVFEEEGALVVVDYKTDRVNTPDELVERYGEQLRLYAHMLTDNLSVPVKELILYSFHLGTQVAAPLQ